MFDLWSSPVPGVRYLPVHYWSEQKAWRAIAIGKDGIHRVVYFYEDIHDGIQGARHAAEKFALQNSPSLRKLFPKFLPHYPSVSEYPIEYGSLYREKAFRPARLQSLPDVVRGSGVVVQTDLAEFNHLSGCFGHVVKVDVRKSEVVVRIKKPLRMVCYGGSSG